MKPPAYISCEWALNYHGISLQSPQVCTVITLSTSVGKKRRVEYQGNIIEFSKISPSLFFGFAYQHNFCVASSEKAILDTLYYRGVIPAHDELDFDELDINSLLKMAEKFPLSVTRKLFRLSNLKVRLDNEKRMVRL